MTIWQAIILGIVQGATEFIPVSSSGHLVLVPWLFGWDPPGLTFTVAVHLGTIVAVFTYFWRDFWEIIIGAVGWVRTRDNSDPALKLALLIAISAIPAVIVGLGFEDQISAAFESPFFSALMLIVTAGLLFAGERIGRLEKDVEAMTIVDSIMMGLAQALAILPGISRSGATIAAGRAQHMERESAARFSFLMSAPVIVGAGLLQTLDLVQEGVTTQGLILLGTGFVAAGVSAYLVIAWLLNFLKTRSTTVFSIYCLAMATFSLLVVALRG